MIQQKNFVFLRYLHPNFEPDFFFSFPPPKFKVKSNLNFFI